MTISVLALASLLFIATSDARPVASASATVRKSAGKSSGKQRRRARARPRGKRKDLWPPMKLEHLNTREKLTLRVYDRRGRNHKSSLKKLRRFLRCHQTGRSRQVHWRLVRNLYKVSRHFKGKTIKVYSGYRHRRVSRLRGSRHIRGRAVDFRVAGVNKRTLRDYLRKTFKKCGVGYYPNSPFIHFDVRDQRAFWVDVSGRGEDYSYVNAHAYLKKERKGTLAARRKSAADKPGVIPATPAKPAASRDKAESPAPVSAPVPGPAPLGPTPVDVNARGAGGPAEPSPKVQPDRRLAASAPPGPSSAATPVSKSGGGRGGAGTVLAE